MEEKMIEKMRQQHFESYKQALLENIKNNTTVLVDDDIMSLIGTPPLDSMDLIKNKILELAKKNRIVLNTEELSNMLDLYRNSLFDCCDKIKNKRVNILSKKVHDCSFSGGTDIIIFYKKDFINLNKDIKKILKDQLSISLEKKFLNKVEQVFDFNIDESIKNKIIVDITKYMKGSYQRQLLENFDIKVLVKDTTLINGIKEQSERYLFTLSNSRLLNEFDN